MSTPIESRALWAIHHAAADAAKAKGACRDCQQRAGFAATSSAQGVPADEPECHRTPRPSHDHPWRGRNRAAFEEAVAHGRNGR
jgi:hypothetical protein